MPDGVATAATAAAVAGPAPRVSDAARRATVGVALAGVFLAFLDVTIVNIAFPAIHASFGSASLPHISWVLNAYNVVFAALLVPAGRIADIYGRRRLFLFGLGAFGVSSALCAAAPSADALIAARVLQAIAAAILVPTSGALSLAVMRRESQAQVIALWGAAGAVAAAAGPALGGIIVDGIGWRWIFLVNPPLTLLLLVAGLRVLPESREGARVRRPDALGGTLFALGAGALTLAIVQGKDWGWGSARVLAAFGVGAALLAVFLVRSARHPSPMFEPALLRNRRFGVSTAAIFILATAFFAMLLCNVLFLTSVWHYSVLDAGLAIVPSPLFAALAAPPAARLAAGRDPRPIIAAGGLLFGAGCLLLALRTGVHPNYVADWLPAASLTGAGSGIAFSLMAATGVSALPPDRYAVGTGIISASRQLGAVLGVAMAVLIIQGVSRLHPADVFHVTWELAAAVAVISALVGASIGATARQPA